MENVFITITGQNHYLGLKPFKVGRLVKLIKEPDNDYDENAICAVMPFIDTVGYVANSTYTVFAGTYSAGRLYDKIGDYAYAQVMFITHSSVIALVLSPEEVEEENNINDIENEVKDIKRNHKDDVSSHLKIGFK